MEAADRVRLHLLIYSEKFASGSTPQLQLYSRRFQGVEPRMGRAGARPAHAGARGGRSGFRSPGDFSREITPMPSIEISTARYRRIPVLVVVGTVVSALAILARMPGPLPGEAE